MRSMKCLTVKQPWAWLIVNGHKGIENRQWTTSYTGPLLIHAGKSDDETFCRRWLHEHRERLGETLWRETPTVTSLWAAGEMGAVVGVAWLESCVKRECRSQILHPEPTWWMADCDAWVLRNAMRLDRPVPLRGQQGLFDVDGPPLLEVVTQISPWLDLQRAARPGQ